MNKFLKCIMCYVFICIILTSCKGISKNPTEGAEQYCEELASYAAKNDYQDADELTKKYLKIYDEKDLYTFLIELKRQLSIPEKHHLGIFISNAESSKYPNMMELMRRVLAASEAKNNGVQYTSSGTEKAALFCSILNDYAKQHDYQKAKSLLKKITNEYVTEFYPDGAVYLNDDRYKECKEFCLSLKQNMTQELMNFLNSENMKSEENTNFQLMSLAGFQAAEEDKNNQK